MKYKKLTKEQILISLDRLTRFKNTKEKYLRVFSEILTSCLIEPKFRKSDIENMDFSLISEYVSEIFNDSLENISSQTTPIIGGNIQKFLQDYENSVFVNDDETQKLLNNNINYIKAIELIPDTCPINLKWLAHVTNYFICTSNNQACTLPSNILRCAREQCLLKFPVENVILVEGITEEILLPAFSKFLGYDFYANGVQIIAAGGKNKKYYELSQELKLPIFVLLDKDAEENINQIKPKLRDEDKIHLVSCGEFEDLLPKSLVIKTVNEHCKNFLKIAEDDLITEMPTAKVGG